jgi:hypothetical protein
MSRLLVFVLGFAGLVYPAPDPNPELLRVRNVYVMSMPRGLDQYLANRLVREGKYQVVTDPQLADAVFTDRLGPDFEQRFDDLYAPKAAEAPKPDDSSSSLNTALAWGEAGPQRASSFSSAAGNLFLVDRASKVVLWSSHKRPKRTTPEELYSTSDWHVERLLEERKRAEKQFPSGPVAPPPVSAPAAQPDTAPADAAPPAAAPTASPEPAGDSSQPSAK